MWTGGVKFRPCYHRVMCADVTGTYAGVTENLPYLKSLGINAIELLPIHEFNELEYYTVCRLTKSCLTTKGL